MISTEFAILCKLCYNIYRAFLCKRIFSNPKTSNKTFLGGLCMRLFESKEDRRMREAEEARERRLQEERDREEERLCEKEKERQESEKEAREKAEWLAELEDELVGEDTDIITIHLQDDFYAWRKQIALNFMFKHGYICVQNDFCRGRYALHHDLTFVKKEHADFFKMG